jgi:hypothetical protein
MLADGLVRALGIAPVEGYENGAVLALIDPTTRFGQAFFLECTPGRFIVAEIDRFQNCPSSYNLEQSTA